MSEHMKVVVAEAELHDATLKKYLTGFVVSITITLTAYVLATGSLSKNLAIGIISVLAIGQFVLQMVFFLHVGSERRPRWKLAVMLMMLGVVLILVGGSLWIMSNLNYRMTPQEMQRYLKSQDAL